MYIHVYVCIAFSCMCLDLHSFSLFFCGIFSLRLVGFLKLDNSELKPVSASNALLSGSSAAAEGGVATNGSKDGISQFNHTDSKSGSFGGFIQSARLAVLCIYVYTCTHSLTYISCMCITCIYMYIHVCACSTILQL